MPRVFGLGLLALMVASIAYAQPVGEWYATGSPRMRLYPAFVAEPSRGTLLLFGGLASFQPMADTWTWDGGWSRTIRPEPPARSEVMAAHDESRGVTVLFGGRAAGTSSLFGDTWEWDGERWTQVASGGPSPRRGGVMVYDPDRGTALLLGGRNTSENLNDMWEWDGSSWTRLSDMTFEDAESEVRVLLAYRGAAAFDPISHEVLLLNQWGGLYAWDGIAWTERGAVGVGFSQGYDQALMAFDPHRGIMITTLLGTNAYILWDGVSSTYVEDGPLPSGEQFHGLTFDEVSGRVIAIGGGDDRSPGHGPALNLRTLAFDGTSWVDLTEPIAPDVDRGRAVFDAARESVVAFGGYRMYGPNSDETWAWDGGQWSLLDPPNHPLPQYYTSMAYDSDRELTVLMGGWPPNPGIGDTTWEFDGTDWTLVASTGPNRRYGCGMCYDSVRQEVLLYGGSVVDRALWAWNGVEWKTYAPIGPAPMDFPLLEFDEQRGVAVLHGRPRSGSDPGTTWEWDGSSWSRIDVPGPGPREGAISGYAPGLGVIVAGGDGHEFIGGPRRGDTWAFDGQRWTRIAKDSPGIAAQTMGTFDPVRGEMIAFGYNISLSLSSTFESSQTWHLRPAPVPCSADWDDSGGRADAADFAAYLNDWVARVPRADLYPPATNGQPAGDAQFTSSDFLEYLNMYNNGC